MGSEVQVIIKMGNSTIHEVELLCRYLHPSLNTFAEALTEFITLLVVLGKKRKNRVARP